MTYHYCNFLYNFRDSYVAALKAIQQYLVDLGFELAASYSMSDFELNIRTAIKEVFPMVNLRGCHFHYGQRLWNRVVDSGLKSDYSKKEYQEFASFIRASIGLSFVPLDRLESEAVPILHNMAKELKKRHQSFAHNFLSYIKRYWIHGSYKPSTWNFYQKQGVTTNNHAEGYNNRIGNHQGLPVHPNPYLLVDVIRKELKIGIDDALCAKIGKPNLKSSGGKSQKIKKLIAQRKELMKNLAKRNTDLPTYMKAIGALSIDKDKRVTDEDVDAAESVAEEQSQTDMSDIVYASRQSIGGNDLRQLRDNLHFSSTFASTQVPPSFTAPDTSILPSTTPMIPQKKLIEEAGMYVMNRLLQSNMVLSATQPQTPADGNCFIHCILDQIMYDPQLRFMSFSLDTFRSTIVNSLNFMIGLERIESPLTPSQRLDWLNRMGTDGEFADHIFLQLTANVLDRNIVIRRVISDEVTTISPVNGIGAHHIYPSLNVLFYEETEFIHGHYQSIRPGPIQPQPQTQPQPQPPVTRQQLPSVADSIGQPVHQSTAINQTETCNNICDSQNSVRSRNNREQSYMSTSNIIEKRTRASKK